MARHSIGRWVLRLSMSAAVLLTALPATAGAAEVKITKPSAGSLSVKDVEIGGSVGEVTPDAPAYAKSGDDLTIEVAWTCPAGAGGASVTIAVTDADGNPVHDAGYGALPANDDYATTWTGLAAGSYTITVTVECYVWDNRTQPWKRISLGTDTDTRTVTVL